jgi:hypothetical protein
MYSIQIQHPEHCAPLFRHRVKCQIKPEFFSQLLEEPPRGILSLIVLHIQQVFECCSRWMPTQELFFVVIKCVFKSMFYITGCR